MNEQPLHLFMRTVVVTLLILAAAFLGYGVSAPWACVVSPDGEQYLMHAVGGVTALGLAEIGCVLIITLLAMTSSRCREVALVGAIGAVGGLIVLRARGNDLHMTHAPALATVGFALAAVGCIVTACLPAEVKSCETRRHDEDGIAVSRARLAARRHGARPGDRTRGCAPHV